MNRGGNTDSLTIKVPNNKYQNCPALMADGRHFTDYRSNSQINMQNMEQRNIRSNYGYRNFLTNNGRTMVDIDRMRAQDKNECLGCDAKQINNMTICKTDVIGQMCEPFDINGLGRASIAIQSKKVPTVSQLNKSIDQFNMFLETNLTEVAARPGIMCDTCVIKK